MKPVPFEYHRPGSIAEACALLGDDPDSLMMAGGQTLMPMLAMRLARPSRIIDILRIPGLSGIEIGNDHVIIGATTRQCDVERSGAVEKELPLLFRAMPWVGHPPTRRRGTIGGSIANGDPTAEIGLVATALGADILVDGPMGKARAVPIEGFFIGPMMTALPAGSMITALRFPRRADRRRVGAGFAEIAQRHGDYAIAAAAAEIKFDDDGLCKDIRLAVGGAADIPVRLDLSALNGSALAEPQLRDAIEAALAPLDMMEDHHSSGAYRRRAAVALAVRAAVQARDDAMGRA